MQPHGTTYAGKRGRIVFARLLNPKDESTTQLFALSPATGRIRQLTDFQGCAFDPDYSPNGREIAFERRGFPGGPDATFRIAFDGSNCLLWPVPRHR